MNQERKVGSMNRELQRENRRIARAARRAAKRFAEYASSDDEWEAPRRMRYEAGFRAPPQPAMPQLVFGYVQPNFGPLQPTMGSVQPVYGQPGPNLGYVPPSTRYVPPSVEYAPPVFEFVPPPTNFGATSIYGVPPPPPPPPPVGYPPKENYTPAMPAATAAKINIKPLVLPKIGGEVGFPKNFVPLPIREENQKEKVTIYEEPTVHQKYITHILTGEPKKINIDIQSNRVGLLNILHSGKGYAKATFETGEEKKNLNKENKIQIQIKGQKEGIEIIYVTFEEDEILAEFEVIVVQGETLKEKLAKRVRELEVENETAKKVKETQEKEKEQKEREENEVKNKARRELLARKEKALQQEKEEEKKKLQDVASKNLTKREWEGEEKFEGGIHRFSMRGEVMKWLLKIQAEFRKRKDGKKARALGAKPAPHNKAYWCI
jgi:hypothetical protein